MSFELPVYRQPDFEEARFRNAPDARVECAPMDGVAPDGYHSTSMYPEYFKLNGAWRLAEESRMDSSVVVREDGRLDVVENRNLKAGDRVILGRSETGEEGIFVHAHGFDEPGEAPVPSAAVPEADADKYEILWECWAKLEESDRGTMEEVAWWSSADSESTPIITEFEKGAEYSYSIWIKAKDGYEFGNDLTLILNGEECTYGYFGASLGGAQCFGDGIVRLRPGGELAGDINGDGSVNTADLVRLMKYIAGNDVIAHVPDVNGDGMVSVADLVRLMKFISGLDVELHPAYPKPESDTLNRPM